MAHGFFISVNSSFPPLVYLGNLTIIAEFRTFAGPLFVTVNFWLIERSRFSVRESYRIFSGFAVTKQEKSEKILFSKLNFFVSNKGVCKFCEFESHLSGARVWRPD